VVVVVPLPVVPVTPVAPVTFIVQFPDAGNPFNITDPVADAQLGCVKVPRVGADGTVKGDGVTGALLKLVQPVVVLVTVKVMEPTDAVMLDVVAPVLHNRLPEAVVLNAELPQLSTFVITGVAGLVFGAASIDPAVLVQPFTVVVTV
jgi:hypothetical protein